MIFKHCANCQKLTGHKRAFGAGTVIGFLFTFGLWIFAMPFYPIRCSVCGMEIGLKEAGTGLLPKMSAVAIFLSGFFILLFTVIGYLLGNFFPFQLVALVMGGILIFRFLYNYIYYYQQGSKRKDSESGERGNPIKLRDSDREYRRGPQYIWEASKAQIGMVIGVFFLTLIVFLLWEKFSSTGCIFCP